MVKTSPLSGLTIRTATLRTDEVGYIYSCDLEKERDEIPHTIMFKWESGRFYEGESDYDAHSVCTATTPLTCLVDLSEAGYYCVISHEGNYIGHISDDSSPPAETPRHHGFRALSAIEGKAYAVGLRGMVYRLDERRKWTRIDNGLPSTFNIQAIDGFNSSNLFAVGRKGELWRYDGDNWQQKQLPTNINLTAVKCAGDSNVYIAGHNGVLISGNNDTWDIIENDQFDDDIWDLEWFQSHLYISTMQKVYRLNGETLEEVDFGDDPPTTCYQLSCTDNVLWSNGEHDIVSYDGKSWTRIV